MLDKLDAERDKLLAENDYCLKMFEFYHTVLSSNVARLDCIDTQRQIWAQCDHTEDNEEAQPGNEESQPEMIFPSGSSEL